MIRTTRPRGTGAGSDGGPCRGLSLEQHHPRRQETRMTMPHPTARLAAVLAAALLLTACGADNDPAQDHTDTEPAEAAVSDAGGADDQVAEDEAATGTSADMQAAEALDAFPVTVDTLTGEVTIEERPERIISLSPSATEILFAIGAD